MVFVIVAMFFRFMPLLLPQPIYVVIYITIVGFLIYKNWHKFRIWSVISVIVLLIVTGVVFFFWWLTTPSIIAYCEYKPVYYNAPFECVPNQITDPYIKEGYYGPRNTVKELDVTCGSSREFIIKDHEYVDNKCVLIRSFEEDFR